MRGIDHGLKSFSVIIPTQGPDRHPIIQTVEAFTHGEALAEVATANGLYHTIVSPSYSHPAANFRHTETESTPYEICYHASLDPASQLLARVRAEFCIPPSDHPLYY